MNTIIAATALICLGVVLALPSLSFRRKRQNCEHVYHDSITAGSQDEGRGYCKSSGYKDLSGIQTIEDFDLASHYLASRKDGLGDTFHTSGRWNGSHFVWLSVNISVGDPRSPYIPIYPRFPEVYPITDGSCLVLHTSNYSTGITWRIDQCTANHHFLCQYRQAARKN